MVRALEMQPAMTYSRKACSHPGCPAVHTNKGLYCDKHYTPKDDSYRPNAAERGYGPEWRAYSKRFIREHPWCVECDRPSQVTDHIKPHKGDMRLLWDPRNHQALCKQCHDRKTYEKDGGLGR